MSKIDYLLDEPTDKPVDSSKSVNWWKIALIKIGIYISLPGFVTGAKIGNAVGFYNSIYVFVIAGVILGVMASITGAVGSKTRLSTYVLTQYVFGIKGALLINLIFAISLFGWFGINIALFGSAIIAFIGVAEETAQVLFAVTGGAVMVLTTIFGFKALDKLSQLAVPVLFVSLFIFVYVSFTQFGWLSITAPRPETMGLGKAISAVVGGAVVGAVIFPDVCRYAYNVKHGIVAAILTFVIVKPLILMASAIPALATGYQDVLTILSSLKIGGLAFGFVIFTTWTSNNGNIYGASLSLSTLFKQFKYWQLVLISGCLGTLFGVSGVMHYFIPFLHLLGIALSPVASIYVVHFFFISDKRYDERMLHYNSSISMNAMFAWGVGCIFGYLTLYDFFSFTAIPAMDSLIMSGILFYLLKRPVSRKYGDIN